MRYRGISNLLALLIIVIIIVGVAITSSGIISGILLKQVPSGGDLVLSGFYWWWDEDDGKYAVYIKGLVSNIGNDRINITDVWVSVGGSRYNLRFTKLSLAPNDWSELFAYGGINSLPKTSRLTVFVRYCSIKQCSTSFIGANERSTEYLIREVYYTVTLPRYIENTVTTTTTITVTSTIPSDGSYTTTQTITTTITRTQTTTMTTTTTATVTTTVTKPAWPIEFSSCYGIDDYVYVFGSLDRKVDKDAEIVPYVVKVYDCTIFRCNLLGVVPFEWTSARTIQAKYGPVNIKPFHSIKIEIWSIDPNSGIFKDKIHEEIVDTSVRCA